MIFYVVVAIGFFTCFNAITFEAAKNVDNPIMALEFVEKAGELQKLLGNNPEAKAGLKSFLILDSFAFVPLYFGFLLAMGYFLSRTRTHLANSLCLVVVIISSIAAFADWMENLYSLEALDMVFVNVDDPIDTIFMFAHIKWISLFVVVGLLAGIFWRGSWWNAASLFLILSSIAGLVGLAIYLPLISFALVIQLSTILIVGILFMSPRFRVSFLLEH